MSSGYLLNLALLVAVGCSFSACERQASSPPQSAATASDQVTPVLSAKIDRLEQQLRLLEFRVDGLQVDSSALISTEDKLYGLVRTTHGTFTIAAKNVTPYLDGFKVVLDVGNLTSADFSGAELSITWGANFGQKKQFKLLDRFRAGFFSDVEVALTPAKAEDVKKLIADISVNQLVLRR